MQNQASEENQDFSKNPANFSLFTPSVKTKACYFSVRKKERTLGRINFPGLFDYEEGHDKSLAITVFVVEVLALLVLARVLYESSDDIPLLLISIGAVAFLGFDFVAAWVHHFTLYPLSNKIKNELLLVFPSMRSADDDSPYGDFRKFEKFRIKFWRKVVSYGAIVLLFSLAIVKYILYIENVDVYFEITNMPSGLRVGINGLVFLAYFFCVYVHLFHTGYFLAYVRLKSCEREDKKKFFGANAQERRERQKKHQESPLFSLREVVDELKKTQYAEYDQLVPRDTKNVDDQLTAGITTIFTINGDHLKGHEINEETLGKYKIVAYGLLTDDQLDTMVENQKTNLAKAAIALWGHYIQVQSLKGKQS